MFDCFWFDNFLNFGQSGIRCACLQQEQCPSLNWLASGGGLARTTFLPFWNPRVGNLCPVLVSLKNEQSSSSVFEILFWWSFKSVHSESAFASLFRLRFSNDFLTKVMSDLWDNDVCSRSFFWANKKFSLHERYQGCEVGNQFVFLREANKFNEELIIEFFFSPLKQ